MKRSTKRGLAGARHEVEDHLRVGGRLADGAVAHELLAQRQAVREIAVVGHREAAAVELGEEGLHVAQHCFAGGGVADVADGGRAGEALDHPLGGEVVAHEPVPALRVEGAPVEGDDAGRFLAPVLQGVQAERRDGGGVRVAEDAEDAALLAKGFGFEVAQRSILKTKRPVLHG